MKTVKIEKLETSLYHRRPGHERPDSCWVSLNLDTGVLRACTRGTQEDAAPEYRIWNGNERQWLIPALRVECANALLTLLAPLCEVFLQGVDRYQTHFGYRIMRYAKAAEEACELIRWQCSDAFLEEDEIETRPIDWYLPSLMDAALDAGVSAKTTDAELQKLVDAKFEGGVPERLKADEALAFFVELRDSMRVCSESAAAKKVGT